MAGCGKKTPKKPQTDQRSVTLAQFLKGKRIHFQLDNGAGPFWSEFAPDGTVKHSDRPAGTYEVHGLKVDVRDSNGPIKKVELVFLSSEISAGDTFEAKALGGIKRVHGKVLKVEKTPVLTTKIKTPPKPPKLVPRKLIADPIVEKAIRKAAKKPTGELTKADFEKVTSLDLASNQLTDLPKGLEKLTQLTRLTLQDNKLTSVKGLEKLTQLTYLDLAINQLTDEKGLEKLTKLEFLFLLDNPALTKAQIAELHMPLPECEITSNPKK